MSRGFSLKATLLALLSLPISNAAIAGVAENMGGVADMLKRTAPVTKAQYDTSDDGDLCWYDQGWRGPGWYLCGDDGTMGSGGSASIGTGIAICTALQSRTRCERAIALSASRADRAFASAASTLFTTPAPALLGHDRLPATCP